MFGVAGAVPLIFYNCHDKFIFKIKIKKKKELIKRKIVVIELQNP